MEGSGLVLKFESGDEWLVTSDQETKRLRDIRHQISDPHIVISSDSEKSLSCAAWRSMFGNSKRETCYPLSLGHRLIYIAAKRLPQV